METNVQQKTNTYEGMFLLAAAQGDFEAASQPIQAVFGRYGAKILSIRPWDERRLAYEIRGHKRGLYVLTYFEIDPLRITEIEHDCQLDENILRVLILRRDHLTQEEIDAETPAMSAPQPAETADKKPTSRDDADSEDDTSSNDDDSGDDNDGSDDTDDNDDSDDEEDESDDS